MKTELALKNNADIMKLIAKLSEGQVITNNTLLSFDNRINRVENVLEKEVYLTNSQLREVSRQVKDKVLSICRHNGYDYRKTSRILFQAIYRDINGQYNVPSYRELPRIFFTDIIETVKIWDITESIKDRIMEAA